MSEALTGRPDFIDRHWFIRLLEIIPGSLAWLALTLPIVLSLFSPVWIAYFIIAFDLYWMIKSLRQGINLIRGYARLRAATIVDWNARLAWVNDPSAGRRVVSEQLDRLLADHPDAVRRSWKIRTDPARLKYLSLNDDLRAIGELETHARTSLDPKTLYNAVILATYNESLDILEPSIKALTQVDYPLDQLMLVIAYEERGGAQTEANANYLIEHYGHKFAYAAAIKHPSGISGEVPGGGKGPNISYAGKLFAKEIMSRGIDPSNVIITTFDSDHRASKHYFSYLSYVYATDPNRDHKSYQPIPLFYNNIWDAPAAMRVIAAGNSFWTLMETMRPHRLRNFAAHAQGLQALIIADFWSVTTIVEDGHQFWRSYFAYDGDHHVVPIYAPIYQDAVLADGYIKTFRAQYLQLRRWAWGVSDFPYAVRESIANRRIPWSSKLVQLIRLLDSHFSWATAAITLTSVAYLPLFLNRQFSYQTLAHQLPIITSHILQVSSVGLIITVFISLISLPPRPERYKPTRSVAMAVQWILLPVTSILLGSVAAIDSQTRLMFGRYLGFYVTDKAVKK